MSKYIIATQLSTVHSSPENLSVDHVYRYVGEIIEKVPIDILVAGWEEKPDLFNALTSPDKRLSKEVFLWYPFLSDYPGMEASHLVLNINLGISTGWGGYDGTGISETFRQACPNNPDAVNTSLHYLEHFLLKYQFDGVFIDKIRFPSMANGLNDVLSCFCPFCKAEALKEGLDLDEVISVLQFRDWKRTTGKTTAIPQGARWLEILIKDVPLIQHFIRFRADSVTRVISRISNKVRSLGKKLSFDVFSPGLAPLVGQDFLSFGKYADWVKPMIYRFGNGPSSLRSEIPSMVRELGGFLGLNTTKVMDWVAANVDGLNDIALEEIEKVAPLNLLRQETEKAVRLFQHTPVYLGLETVSIPGGMTVTPRNVEEILDNGEAAGVQGFVLSCDLLHTPIENVLPVKSMR